jgi:hypothetical protein
MTNEATVRVAATVPVSLAEQAAERAARQWPGITKAGMLRLALARLAGLTGDEYGDPLPIGRKPKQRP